MARWLTIVLPGRNYGPIGATLRLPCLTLEQVGAQTEVIVYPPVATDLVDLVQASCDQISRLMIEVQPERVTFVAKSVGTAVLAARSWSLYGSVLVDAIWLTPLFGESTVRDGAIRRGWRSLLVAGDADPSHSPDGFEKVRRKLSASSIIIHGANHSLEIPADPGATLDALARLTDAVTRFVAAPEP